MAAVSNEAVAKFFPLVDHFAKRFNGVANVEYDDLFQEGSLYVFKQLRDGKAPSGQGIKNSMRYWVRQEARRGFVDEAPLET